MGKAYGKADDQGQEGKGGSGDDEEGAAREVAPRLVRAVRPRKHL